MKSFKIAIFSLKFLCLLSLIFFGFAPSEKIILKSNSFENNGEIPSKFTCDGRNISPQLSWSNFPEATKSFVVICEDPDAYPKTWVHWIAFNILPNINEIPEGTEERDRVTSNGITFGVNDFKDFGYTGMCPPEGNHKYVFKIYAIDIILGFKAGIIKQTLLEKMEGHILAEGELIGYYSRKKN